MDKERAREYWERNIGGFGGFYEDDPHENLPFLYRLLVVPFESWYMQRRHRYVTQYLKQNVRLHMVVADIGCGSGVYTKMLSRMCKKVYAIDYTQAALDLTLQSLSVDESGTTQLLKMDITNEPCPTVDVAIAIGVLPYVGARLFFRNVLPYTNQLLFNFLDAKHPINRIRRSTFLDARGYQYQKLDAIEAVLGKSEFSIIRKHRLATGFVIEASK